MPTAACSAATSPSSAEQRRVDARGTAGPASSIASAAARSCSASSCVGALGRPVGERLGQAQVHRQGDQVLLRAVVDVALEEPALGVLGVDQALPRARAAPRRAPTAPRPLARARRGAGHRAGPSPAWAARPANSRSSTDESGTCVALLDDEDAEQLAAVAHRRGTGGPASSSAVRGSGRSVARAAARAARWRPASAGRPRPATPAPTRRRCPRPAPAPSAPGAPRRRSCRSRSRRTAAARRTATGWPPCTAARREPLEAGLDRVEGQRHHRRREDREGHVGRRRCARSATPPPSTTTT